MTALAITGSLGSGKSTLFQRINRYLTVRNMLSSSFSADEENGRLLREDLEVRREIEKTFGPCSLNPDGLPDRSKLSAMVISDSDARKALEAIMHPRLEKIWHPLALRHRGKNSPFFVAEIPLLYERNLSGNFDSVLVIGCSNGIRTSRLASRRSMPVEQVERWLTAQQSQSEKLGLADHLVWNDGSLASLDRQINQFFHYLNIP